ncbi:MAG TPA: hypothetical protein DDY98_06095 [Ruminococcaceae bacterium]|nr:hypothetical protein [Oscillospiraceae bacterium]
MRSPFNKPSRQTTAFKKSGSWSCGYHTGVDRVCDTDKTIVAIADGTVQRVNDCGSSYGNHVVYRTNSGIVVLCAHLAQKPTVTVGQKVKQGQMLGTMGNTGNSSGAHLHIELQNSTAWSYAKNLLDPNKYIDWNEFFKTEKEEFMEQPWKNGSTKEPVYQTVADCKNKRNSIGFLSPNEKATCTAIAQGCYLLLYNTATTQKCGFVAYNGGVMV